MRHFNLEACNAPALGSRREQNGKHTVAEECGAVIYNLLGELG
jgi:hypothetical protein